MATSNGPLQPWTCPHCAAVWHSGRQYCVDCGYGLAPAGPPGAGAEYARYEVERQAAQRAPESASRFTDNVQELRLAQELGGRTADQQDAPLGLYGEEERRQARSSDRMHMHAEVRDTNESALRRSLDAESALQAEVALLRERTAQLTAKLDEQRRTFAAGVQQMLQPVQHYFGSHGDQHVPPFDALIPELLRRLEPRVAAPQPRRPDAERFTTILASLTEQLALLARRVSEVEHALAHREPVPLPGTYDPSPQTYDTFVMSDAQAADIERAILDAQTRGQRYGG